MPGWAPSCLRHSQEKGHRPLRVSNYIPLSCQGDPPAERIEGPLHPSALAGLASWRPPHRPKSALRVRAALDPRKSRTGPTVLMGGCQAGLLPPLGTADQASGGAAEQLLALWAR